MAAPDKAREVDLLWAALLDGVEPVDESIEITSSDINRQTAERMSTRG